MRVLEEALQVLAREHHDLERSIISNHNHNLSMSAQATAPESVNINGCSIMFSAQENLASGFGRTQSFGGISLSDTTTDIDEYFDAFDDDDDGGENVSDRTLGATEGENTVDGHGLDNQLAQLTFSETEPGGGTLPAALKTSNTATFHTARDQTYLAPNDVTINDSISTLSPDGDEDNTLASIEMNFSR